MFLLFLGILVFGLVLIKASKTQNLGASPRCDTNPDDRKHKWVIRFENNDRKGYLVCKSCGKIPGDD